MSQTATARRTTGTTLRPTTVGLAVVAVAILGALLSQSPSSEASSFSQARTPGAHRAVDQSAPLAAPPRRPALRGDPGGATGHVTETDGALPSGVTVSDDEYPGIANLDPDLRQALRDAAADAADDGIELYVTSGWRSPEYQDQLLREAVWKYGSEEEAGRWVATPDTSAHVSGDAIDIGPFDATAWLSEHGATYGLCQIYANEPWHYELRPQAIDGGCPPMYADTHDGKMQQ